MGERRHRNGNVVMPGCRDFVSEITRPATAVFLLEGLPLALCVVPAGLVATSPAADEARRYIVAIDLFVVPNAEFIAH